MAVLALAAGCSSDDASLEDACGLSQVEVAAIVGSAVGEPSVSVGPDEGLLRDLSRCQFTSVDAAVSFESLPPGASGEDRERLLSFGYPTEGEARADWGPDGWLWQDTSVGWGAHVDADGKYWMVTVSSLNLEGIGEEAASAYSEENRAALEEIVSTMIG